VAETSTGGHLLKRKLKGLLRRAGYELFRTRGRYAEDGLLTIHNDHFRSDPRFRSAYERGIQASAEVDPHFEWRTHVALWAARTALRVPGDFVECGVNAGFISSAIMHGLSWGQTGRRFYLIDTFAGPDLRQFSGAEIQRGRLRIAQDALAAGAYVTDIERIEQNFAEWSNVEVVRGLVPDVLAGVSFGPVAFLHLDLNCALPEREALQFFWNRITPGGIVLLDDYAYYGHDSQTEAVDQFAAAVETEVLSLPTGQGLIVR